MAALQIVNSPTFASTVSAYGIITRVLTFCFLPLLGLSHAMQTITGNNYGAAQWQRSNGSLLFAMGAAFVYCIVLQMLLRIFAVQIGQAFVDDPSVVAEVARILPVTTLLFFLSGPLMMIATHFQAVGDARRAALLGLSKLYLFAIPMTFLLAFEIGEAGIWIASPIAEAMLLILTLIVLAHAARRQSLRWGMFITTPEGQT